MERQAVLATLPQEGMHAYIAGGLHAVTPHTITHPDRSRTELRGISGAGLRVCREELEGASFTTAPLRPERGRPVAALSTSRSKSHMSPSVSSLHWPNSRRNPRTEP
ncbi:MULTISPECIES: IclR family transcriptional regulator C-terminal domain-containing protein [unclassified Streptomyces]|uniref:IclR family transcriptional regulator domain-containing protein n=1 Tax=unclassified Streptomyces TaxID=2593676 RepID=UPI00225726EE|nr:IclR family transcriptional regulator C-terminal domain-containing protein [Streptomyces sp. NBC_00268]MCX5188899.1 IclR family transcriptional regulator C-terminal domain-containing protein [Streptomyces sp. NBC_00268]